MKKMNNPLLTKICVAVCAALSAQAWGDEIDPERLEPIAALAMPQSEIGLGAGYLSKGSRRFGQYSGVREEGGYGLVDVNWVRLDKGTGTWSKFSGRNLGLDNRELMFDLYRQGQSRFIAGYSQITRYEPYVVNTRLVGIGSESLAVNAAGTTLRPVDLELKRELLSLGFDQSLSKTLAARVRYTHETKEGARLYGRGNFTAATTSAAEFLAEPNDRTTQTLEVSLSHTGKDLQLSGGYYGTLFVNHADALYINGGNAGLASPPGGVPAFSLMSQPLSNDSHQFFLTGGYNLPAQTRASFKLSKTVARQNEEFAAISSGVTYPGAPSTLNGRVDTLIAYLDVTSMAFDRLDLQANIRYEDRDDKTPEKKFVSAAAPNQGTAGVTGFNKPRSWSSLKYKAEAGYQLPAEFKLVAGWELDHQQRESPESFRKVNFREQTDESTTRLEIKRTFLDTVSGALSVSESSRTGSEYLGDTYTLASVNPPVNPLLWADRDRTAWKGTLDWNPTDKWAVHFVHEEATDQYTGLTLGPRDGSRTFSSVDASYALSDRWQWHLWWSRDDIQAEQSTMVNPVNPPAAADRGQFWQANLRQLSEGFGAGVQAKLRSGIKLGADVSYSEQRAEQRMHAITGNSIASLPDYSFDLLEIKLFGEYPINKASGVRLDYAYFDWRTNDWTWTGWAYVDGTTVTQEANQKTHFVGASYYYRWR